jgi:hypothetical protein
VLARDAGARRSVAGADDWLHDQAASCVEMVRNETAFRPRPMLGSPLES